MARAPRTPAGQDVPAPSPERPDDAGSRHDALWTIAQQIHELTGDFGRTTAKTERLIVDVGELSKDVRELRNSFALAKGFAIAAVILIPICAGLVWWLVGGKLNEIRDQLYQVRPPISAPNGPSVTPSHP